MKVCKNFAFSMMVMAVALLCLLILPLNAHAASADDLTFTLNETGDGYIVSGYDESAEGELIIPATYNGLPVTSIREYVFGYCSKLTNITIPDGITSIGDYAFSNCSSLTSITIPNSVTTIGNRAFSGCSSLISITVKGGNSAYHSAGNCLIETETKTLIAGCQASEIPADGSVSIIDEAAFNGCRGLANITIPDSITIIDDAAFSGCSGLTSITIPDSVNDIGDYAFSNCSSLTSIIIPDSVTWLGDYVFRNCPIKKLLIAEGSTTVTCTMVVCGSLLEEVVIPDSVTSIGAYAFNNCHRLTSVTYCGTQEQWDAIVIGSCNYELIDAKLQFHNTENGVCAICGFGRSPDGDVDGDGTASYNDAVQLLLHTLFPNAYPLDGVKADVDGNGTVDYEDAVYLLLHVMFGETFYPLKA